MLHEHRNRRMILKMSLLQSSLPQNYIFLQMGRVILEYEVWILLRAYPVQTEYYKKTM